MVGEGSPQKAKQISPQGVREAPIKKEILKFKPGPGS
jgi:hypothetical protein